MTDMLVKLYELPKLHPILEQLETQDIIIRRPMAPEKRMLLAWISEHFSPEWADEYDVAFGRDPLACFIAHRGKTILGFACYNGISKGMFGPTGVIPSARGHGIGAALLVASLQAMHDEGYSYAVIGGVGPADFYGKVVGAKFIDGSTPGIYQHLLAHKFEG